MNTLTKYLCIYCGKHSPSPVICNVDKMQPRDRKQGPSGWSFTKETSIKMSLVSLILRVSWKELSVNAREMKEDEKCPGSDGRRGWL